MKLAAALADLTEKEWDAQVRQLAEMLGWKRYHVLRSKGSDPGWPDLALVRDRLIMVELKTERGKLTPAQKDWIRRLHHANVEAYVARPRDLDQLGIVLAARVPAGESIRDQRRAWTAAGQLHEATANEAA